MIKIYDNKGKKSIFGLRNDLPSSPSRIDVGAALEESPRCNDIVGIVEIKLDLPLDRDWSCKKEIEGIFGHF